MLAVLSEVAVQQVFPARPPHTAQSVPKHLVPGAVQAPAAALELRQQGSPGPPHGETLLPHWCLLHVPGRGAQLEPWLTHRPFAQQPSLSQVLPTQHVWPGPPHVVPPPSAALVSALPSRPVASPAASLPGIAPSLRPGWPAPASRPPSASEPEPPPQPVARRARATPKDVIVNSVFAAILPATLCLRVDELACAGRIMSQLSRAAAIVVGVAPRNQALPCVGKHHRQ